MGLDALELAVNDYEQLREMLDRADIQYTVLISREDTRIAVTQPGHDYPSSYSPDKSAGFIFAPDGALLRVSLS